MTVIFYKANSVTKIGNVAFYRVGGNIIREDWTDRNGMLSSLNQAFLETGIMLSGCRKIAIHVVSKN